MMKQFQTAQGAAQPKQILVNRDAEARVRFDNKSLLEIGNLIKVQGADFGSNLVNGVELWSLILIGQDGNEYIFGFSQSVSKRLSAGEVLTQDELLGLTGKICDTYVRNQDGTVKMENGVAVIHPTAKTYVLGATGTIKFENRSTVFEEKATVLAGKPSGKK